jgi:hypothetical protein
MPPGAFAKLVKLGVISISWRSVDSEPPENMGKYGKIQLHSPENLHVQQPNHRFKKKKAKKSSPKADLVTQDLLLLTPRCLLEHFYLTPRGC